MEERTGLGGEMRVSGFIFRFVSAMCLSITPEPPPIIFLRLPNDQSIRIHIAPSNYMKGLRIMEDVCGPVEETCLPPKTARMPIAVSASSILA
jgi:hypothetical protein